MASFFRRAAPAASASSPAKETPASTTEIYTVPPEGVKAVKKWDYNEEQLAQIEELKEYTATIALPESDDYYPWEQRFLADIGTHARYMRAAKWKLDDAKKRIKATMEWRREFRPETIEPGDVAIEAETGKIIITGFDKDARPIIYMRPSRENTDTSPRQIRHLIYVLERAIDIMPENQEQVAIVVDYKSATSSKTPSISTGLKVLNILQHHYVERLGRGLVINMPWWINAFFSGIQPFMDPITRDKIRFNPTLTELIDPQQLDLEYGGEYNLEFNKDVYWKTITEFCRITPEGGRVDPDGGNKWYPPSGNGIKYAVDNFKPAAEADAPRSPTATTIASAPSVDQLATPAEDATGLAENLSKATISEKKAGEESEETTPTPVTPAVAA
ncbi:CRAL-TRIO domain-containing protein [Vanrija pseudolonga]|uniref:CRAL-TRIO domain-containing protein n=1 Tax=Vanrija pseudolonga TaxID=143232 RepID=A0AAF0YCA8_9TREE|nr:CRAL-TRIO domain-containing protein [Vanrija pseudolonga]